ncbi:MAG TPA: bifunctional helix-turn-helix transcriptional regulator/GNAT family N-acetyltransferase [Alphaproteobacteria bacterium]|nr:bifunctional helix-turn-helix transcriptional regulator/GNAT family N-acetyltransferase [Alphaproteobacteria bacterium]
MRRFNRFYTQKIGVLREGLLDSPFSLSEARVLYELANRDAPTASELARDLGFDAGYLSRIVRGFQGRRLLAKRRSERDGRQSHLTLTAKGRRAFATLDRRSRAEIGGLLSALIIEDQRRLVAAMRTIEGILAPDRRAPAAYLLRPHRPGDIGWVIGRHGALYAEEYGWDATFEALVAEIAGRFLRDFDAKRERCWIAERDGANVGSVFLVKDTDVVAKLRLLLVDPKARGLGIGRRLVDECIQGARMLGYARLTLWTNDVLHAARHIYERAGFRLAREEPHRSFGHDLIGQYWELAL